MPRALLWAACRLHASALLVALAPGCGPLVDSASRAECSGSTRAIAEIQGSGAQSPLLNQRVEIAGVVSVAPAQVDSQSGFFLASELAGADPRSSDGLFVAWESNAMPARGDRVRARGSVRELNGVTTLARVELLEPCGHAALAARALALDGLALDDLALDGTVDAEEWEGMWIRPRADWTLLDTSALESRGELGISPSGRAYAPGHPLGQAATASSVWKLLGMADRARSWLATGELSEHLRLGARASELTAVVLSGSPPTLLATEPVDFRAPPPARLKPRPPGALRVAALNLDNYFVQPGTRGASSELELSRQRSKLVAALRQLDADILALSELENAALARPAALRETAPAASLADLISALDSTLPSELEYSVSESGADDSDVIRSAIVYRSQRVRPSGPAWFASSSEFRRAPLLQSFDLHGRTLTVGVVHLKSKLCSGSAQVIGAEGCGAETRAREARALAAAVAASALASDVLLIGDFNSDSEETPLLELKRAGFSDLFAGVASADRYSYVFEGRATQLDHALASTSLASALSNAQLWHIDADEPALFGYGLEHPPEAYHPDERRCSDHDPILVDFAL
ncbi:MAG: ExeM/NucH family extracellular endonuclease [Deltaproteobacteria bacterium]